MLNIKYIVLVIAICACFAATPSNATVFNVPGGSLETALDAYSLQSGIKLLVPSDQLKGVRSSGAVGDLAPPEALSRILSGTGFVARRDNSGVMGIVRDRRSETPANTV